MNQQNNITKSYLKKELQNYEFIDNPEKLIKVIVLLSDITKKEGLLALEEYQKITNDKLLNELLFLSLDGIDFDVIDKIILNKTECITNQLKDFFKILTQGTESIIFENGQYRSVAKKLYSIIGKNSCNVSFRNSASLPKWKKYKNDKPIINHKLLNKTKEEIVNLVSLDFRYDNLEKLIELFVLLIEMIHYYKIEEIKKIIPIVKNKKLMLILKLICQKSEKSTIDSVIENYQLQEEIKLKKYFYIMRAGIRLMINGEKGKIIMEVLKL